MLNEPSRQIVPLSAALAVDAQPHLLFFHPLWPSFQANEPLFEGEHVLVAYRKSIESLKRSMDIRRPHGVGVILLVAVDHRLAMTLDFPGFFTFASCPK